MFRPGRTVLVLDVLITASTAGLSVAAAWSNRSWLFGLSLAVVMLPVLVCGCRWLFADLFEVPSAQQSELRLLMKQTLWTLVGGFLVVAVRALVEPTPSGVADPVSLLLLVVLGVPLVQHAVKARHVFDEAVRSQAKSPRFGRVKRVTVRRAAMSSRRG